MMKEIEMLLQSIMMSRKGSMGSIENVYTPQLDVRKVQRAHQELLELGTELERTRTALTAAREHIMHWYNSRPSVCSVCKEGRSLHKSDCPLSLTFKNLADAISKLNELDEQAALSKLVEEMK